MTNLEQPRWKIPEYPKSKINWAGDILRNPDSAKSDINLALKIVDNWRAAHAYPLHVFYMNLRGKAQSRDDFLVVERLKRLESIVEKLKREEGMQLYRMQDIGGCRMVVQKVDEVYEMINKIEKSRIRHKLKKTNDYICQPKNSGYRSVHLIYRFVTDTQDKDIYNTYQMLIELQFRTHLQHIWATAVETMGLITNQALKASQGKKELLRFFALISSLFAIEEKCAIVPNTPCNKNILISEVKRLNSENHILDTLEALCLSVKYEQEYIDDKMGYYVLKLNYDEKQVYIYFFKPSDLGQANTLYDKLENDSLNKPYDIVMVRAKSFETVQRAYPNYFLDINEFINRVKEYI